MTLNSFSLKKESGKQTVLFVRNLNGDIDKLHLWLLDKAPGFDETNKKLIDKNNSDHQ